MAAFLTTENRFQLTLLIFARCIAEVNTSSATTCIEIRWPLPRNGDYCAAEVDTIRDSFANFKTEGMCTPPFIRLYFGSKPARAPHLAAA